MTENECVGITVHFTGPMTIHQSLSPHATALNVGYGDEMVLSETVIEANRDRAGRVALVDMIDAPNSRVRSGAWPDGESRIQYGSPAWDDARAAALRAAALLPTEDEQRAAAARVREVYGSASSARSTTLLKHFER